MNDEQLLLAEAARRIGVKPYQITYAISNNLVADVPRIGNRRIFCNEDLQRFADHFGVILKEVNNERKDSQ